MFCGYCGTKFREGDSFCTECGKKRKLKKSTTSFSHNKHEPFFGSWYIKELLGEGSLGKVFQIERQEFGETYKAALKIITVPQNEIEIKSVMPSGMDERSIKEYFESIVKDFVAECVLMSKLKGNNHVVNYEDYQVIPHVGKNIGWDILIRMELLIPLLDYAQSGKLTHKEVMKLGIDICSALELCQKHNIIHRNIKPENIFVSESGNYKLGDFSIARAIEKTSGGLSKKGICTYMAPEVYKGEEYGSSVDIYSLGIVMYRLLNNNRTPFLPAYPEKIKHSDIDKALTRRISGEVPPAPIGVNERLVEIVLKACSYNPKERYSSPMQMRQELEAIFYEPDKVKEIYPKNDNHNLSLNNKKKGKCPKCDSERIAIASYGLPQPRKNTLSTTIKEHLSRSKDSDYINMGCCIESNSPTHICRDCGEGFGHEGHPSFCRFCENTVSLTMVFCDSCGSRMKNVQTDEDSRPADNEKNRTMNPSKEDSFLQYETIEKKDFDAYLSECIELLKKIKKVNWRSTMPERECDRMPNRIYLSYPEYPQELSLLMIPPVEHPNDSINKEIHSFIETLVEMWAGERFCDGYVAARIESGELLELYTKMQTLYQAESICNK